MHTFPSINELTHWGRVTHICVSKLIIICSDNGLSPGRRQAIIWTNAGILLIGPLGTSFSEILVEIHAFSLKKMRLKMSSGKRWPFCLGLNVLSYQSDAAWSGAVIPKVRLHAEAVFRLQIPVIRVKGLIVDGEIQVCSSQLLSNTLYSIKLMLFFKLHQVKSVVEKFSDVHLQKWENLLLPTYIKLNKQSKLKQNLFIFAGIYLLLLKIRM